MGGECGQLICGQLVAPLRHPRQRTRMLLYVSAVRPASPCRPLQRQASTCSSCALGLTRRISVRPCSLGRRMRILRSKRPARMRAGSSRSARLVAATKTTPECTKLQKGFQLSQKLRGMGSSRSLGRQGVRHLCNRPIRYLTAQAPKLTSRHPSESAVPRPLQSARSLHPHDQSLSTQAELKCPPESGVKPSISLSSWLSVCSRSSLVRTPTCGGPKGDKTRRQGLNITK